MFGRGGGKSTTIAPLLSLLLVDGKTLIVLVVPEQLLDMSATVTRAAFGPTIPTPVLNFAFERSGSDDMQKQLRSILRKLIFTRESGGVTCTTPAAIKSLFLTYTSNSRSGVDCSVQDANRFGVRTPEERGPRCKSGSQVISQCTRGRC